VFVVASWLYWYKLFVVAYPTVFVLLIYFSSTISSSQFPYHLHLNFLNISYAFFLFPSMPTSLHMYPITHFRFLLSTLLLNLSLSITYGPGSSVCILTGYGLYGPGIDYRLGARLSAPVQTGPGAHTASCTMGTGSFPGVKSGQGVTLNPHPVPVPWSRKSISVPLLTLWTVRPQQSLSACTRVHIFTPFRGHYFI